MASFVSRPVGMEGGLFNAVVRQCVACCQRTVCVQCAPEGGKGGGGDVGGGDGEGDVDGGGCEDVAAALMVAEARVAAIVPEPPRTVKGLAAARLVVAAQHTTL